MLSNIKKNVTLDSGRTLRVDNLSFRNPETLF